MTCCFQMSVSFSAIRRAKMSAACPGGNGTMKRTGLLGQGACAERGRGQRAHRRRRPAPAPGDASCESAFVSSLFLSDKLARQKCLRPPRRTMPATSRRPGPSHISSFPAPRARITVSDSTQSAAKCSRGALRSMGFVDIPPLPAARHRLHGAGPVSDRYYEDFKVGDRFVSGGMTMTEPASSSSRGNGIRSRSMSTSSSPRNGSMAG